MPNWEAMAAVGTIARAHGIRGQVIVNLLTDFPETLSRRPPFLALSNRWPLGG